MNDHPESVHRIALIDLMAIVAAAAIAMGVPRAITPILDWDSAWARTSSRGLRAAGRRGWRWSGPWRSRSRPCPSSAAGRSRCPWSGSAIGGGTGDGWPASRGMAASLSAIIGWVWASASAGWLFAFQWAASGTPPDNVSLWFARYLANTLSPIGMAVAIAWSFLCCWASGGRCPMRLTGSAEVVGAYWILVGLKWGGITEPVDDLIHKPADAVRLGGMADGR